MKDLKQKMLNVGFDLISEQGFGGIGIMKIISAADATKGSFYHHFKSKEDFGRILLEQYFEEHLAQLDSFLTDTTMPPKQRVLAYFDNWSAVKVTEDFQVKCLVVKLSGEISGKSNQMQSVMNDGSETIIRHMSAFFNLGGFEIEDSYHISRALYSLWLGSTLLCAVKQDRSILEDAMQQTKLLINA